MVKSIYEGLFMLFAARFPGSLHFFSVLASLISIKEKESVVFGSTLS